ncbi:uncharacterized protein STEHIDRAFT_161416 [Stereum hirsutum FP-91666 SS1]|uniref:uncharacterized protein n=1 Tax=Stereum hirsutum (strain FP-91666) TaxID=721885 RepID=UPI0004449622|nr:uncharacterized protein STEHIDRAFT_161416 [Stereum hirsutum FP-91666 SS1]EIM82064.1 hypothetical protein STEHIDRAFT_161416 [Stereum hirsutum FP-91666 SS1]
MASHASHRAKLHNSGRLFRIASGSPELPIARHSYLPPLCKHWRRIEDPGSLFQPAVLRSEERARDVVESGVVEVRLQSALPRKRALKIGFSSSELCPYFQLTALSVLSPFLSPQSRLRLSRSVTLSSSELNAMTSNVRHGPCAIALELHKAAGSRPSRPLLLAPSPLAPSRSLSSRSLSSRSLPSRSIPSRTILSSSPNAGPPSRTLSSAPFPPFALDLPSHSRSRMPSHILTRYSSPRSKNLFKKNSPLLDCYGRGRKCTEL